MGDSRKTGSSRSVQYEFQQGRTITVLRFHMPVLPPLTYRFSVTVSFSHVNGGGAVNVNEKVSRALVIF
jgi:hypothetical protein